MKPFVVVLATSVVEESFLSEFAAGVAVGELEDEEDDGAVGAAAFGSGAIVVVPSVGGGWSSIGCPIAREPGGDQPAPEPSLQ